MHHFSQHIYLPKTQEELRSTEHKFAKSGFPGAFLSLDVVHCMWKSCPMKYTHLCSGGCEDEEGDGDGDVGGGSQHGEDGQDFTAPTAAS